MSDDDAIAMVSRLFAVAHRHGRLAEAERLIELLEARARGDADAQRGIAFWSAELADVLAEAGVRL